jgi:hypothetical protein
MTAELQVDGTLRVSAENFNEAYMIQKIADRYDFCRCTGCPVSFDIGDFLFTSE